MNPIGTMPYFLAAVSSLLRARSRAASSSNLVWLKRASALRTCASSWIGKRRRPFESTYAKAAFLSCARFLAVSCGISLPRPYPIPLGRAALDIHVQQEPTAAWLLLVFSPHRGRWQHPYLRLGG